MADQTTSMVAVRGCNVGLMRGGVGQPLVILHGASGAGTWLPFMRSLADTYDVIVPEHPGFGTSDTPDWLDNIHDLAYFYLDALDQLDLRAVHLVGVSLGGWIAAELAIRSTQRLSSLTLVDAAGIHVPDVEQIDTFLRTDEQRIREASHGLAFVVDTSPVVRMVGGGALPGPQVLVGLSARLLQRVLDLAQLVDQLRTRRALHPSLAAAALIGGLCRLTAVAVGWSFSHGSRRNGLW